MTVYQDSSPSNGCRALSHYHIPHFSPQLWVPLHSGGVGIPRRTPLQCWTNAAGYTHLTATRGRTKSVPSIPHSSVKQVLSVKVSTDDRGWRGEDSSILEAERGIVYNPSIHPSIHRQIHCIALPTPGVPTQQDQYSLKKINSQQISHSLPFSDTCFYPRPVLAIGYCHCLRLCVCPCVCQSVCPITCFCPRDNSGSVQARITKFWPKMQETLVKVPIVLGGNWHWPSMSNLI